VAYRTGLAHINIVSPHDRHGVQLTPRQMPLQIPQPPVLTEVGVTTPPPIAVPDRFATVRTNPITGRLDYLGVVGTKYEPVQNEESCTLLDALTQDSGAVYATLGRCEAVGKPLSR
jgi:hypothetical protein